MDMDLEHEAEASVSIGSSSENNTDTELVESAINDDDNGTDEDDDDTVDESTQNNISEKSVVQQDNTGGDDEETDTSDDGNYSTNKSINVTTPAKNRNINFVLSKSRISLTKKTMSTGASVGSTPQTVRSTTSPIRIKLSLKKLPIVNKKLDEFDKTSNDVPIRAKAILPKTAHNVDESHASNGSGAKVDQKTVSSSINGLEVDSSLKDAGNSRIQKPLPTVSKAATGTAGKRRSMLPSKQVRIPPITSPGLCMLRSPIPLPLPSSDNSTPIGTKYYTPRHIFDGVMTGAGYTYEQRSEHPHRGSSVQRTVDDMFDTNVKLALHPIDLVPSDLWNHNASRTSASANQDGQPLPLLLIRGLEDSRRVELQKRTKLVESERYDLETGTRKRPRHVVKPLQFRDIVPVSLTIPYPEWYIQKRVEYAAQVKQRESAIIQWQDAQEELEIAQEDYDGRDIAGTEIEVLKSRPTFVNPITIPDIPTPPDPPKLHELCATTSIAAEDSHNLTYKQERLISTVLGFDTERNDEPIDESTHPIYIPKNKNDLVAHLDPHCFHITDGRYFALQSNLIADPNFVGPCAPGLMGVSNSGALATATTSTTTSTSGLTGGGMTMILSASYHSAAAVAPTNLKDETSLSNKVQTPHIEEPVEKMKISDDTLLALGGTPTSVTSKATPTNSSPMDKWSDMKQSTSTTITRTLSDLRKIMEGNDTSLIETFREWIIRAIVHTFRSQKSCNIPFQGPNHETYPDIGKAFAWFGGVKTCDRCKSNKQGVLHCRIRRRHEDPDFDGGDTSAPLLRSLMDAPIENVLVNKD